MRGSLLERGRKESAVKGSFLLVLCACSWFIERQLLLYSLFSSSSNGFEDGFYPPQKTYLRFVHIAAHSALRWLHDRDASEEIINIIKDIIRLFREDRQSKQILLPTLVL